MWTPDFILPVLLTETRGQVVTRVIFSGGNVLTKVLGIACFSLTAALFCRVAFSGDGAIFTAVGIRGAVHVDCIVPFLDIAPRQSDVDAACAILESQFHSGPFVGLSTPHSPITQTI